MALNLMLIPSASCPAHCEYCFGPRGESPVMSEDILKKAVSLLYHSLEKAIPQTIDIVFHGGEPLTVGYKFYVMALPLIRKAFPNHSLKLSVQSNLWLLDRKMCDLFADHGVLLGTSLDGPKQITDNQRGPGYFERTMEGIGLARRRGLGVGCICTFTAQSASRFDEIMDFFEEEALEFSFHASVQPLTYQHFDYGNPTPPSRWTLTPEGFGNLLVNISDRYINSLQKNRIRTIDFMARGISTGSGILCTFRECLGNHLAVGPDGGIYPCQRFTGNQAFRLGLVQEAMEIDSLKDSKPWQLLRRREENIKEECGDCQHYSYCRGGCPYNALAAGNGRLLSLKDPYCSAYDMVFTRLAKKALDEVFSPQNLRQVIDNPTQESMLHCGPTLSLMKGNQHPHELAQRFKQVLAAAALGSSEPPEIIADKLVKLGIFSSPPRVLDSMKALSLRLKKPSRLNNLYIHVTFDCNLRCTHCYAHSGPGQGEHMPIDLIINLCAQAKSQGFRQTVITGGEPLSHPDCERLLDALANIRQKVKPMQTVLRTNLALSADIQFLSSVKKSADKIFVSVDGGRKEHDDRRGLGSYDITVKNLGLLSEIKGGEVCITSIMSAKDSGGQRGNSVRELARQIGIRKVHFKPLLPLGRAANSCSEILREAQGAYLSPKDAILSGFKPNTTCGLGHNLYIEPSGRAYPCYALINESLGLGNASEGLGEIIKSGAFKSLSRHTVDTNKRCRLCTLRYLCGGACRAWGGPPDYDLDDPPQDCGPLFERAQSILIAALDSLNIPAEKWIALGLPFQSRPPVYVEPMKLIT